MASESFQYRALFEYKRERGDDIGLQPGDTLTVAKASLLQAPAAGPGPPAYQDGDERSPRGWLHGTNDRTKEKGDFPGTFVEYVGAVVLRAGPTSRPRPWTPGAGPPTAAGPQTPAAGVSASGADGEVCALSEQASLVVQRLIEAIERHGVDKEHLYGPPHVSSGPLDPRQALDKESGDLDQYDPGTLTDTLRGFLRDLPAPVIPACVYSELLYAAQESQSMEECGERTKRILDSPSVPRANHQLLAHVTRHLARVALAQTGQHGAASPRLLGQAFSGLLFKPSLFSADMNPEHQVRILESLITAGGLMKMLSAPESRASLVWCRSTSLQEDLDYED